MASRAPTLDWSNQQQPARRRAAKNVRRSGDGRFNTVLVFLLICLWQGFPFPLLGIEKQLGNQLYALLVFGGLGAFAINWLRGKAKVTLWHALAAFLFVYCVIASFIYSNFTAPQPIGAWLPLVYTISPLLTVFLLEATGASINNVIKGIFWAGVISSTFLLLNQLAGLNLLESYARGSAIGTVGRVVFFKIEASMAFMIALVWIQQSHGFRRIAFLVFSIAVTAMNCFVFSESRLTMLAVVVALGLAWLFIWDRMTKLAGLFVGIIAGVPVAFFIYQRFFANVISLESYLRGDVSAWFRELTIAHFDAYFKTTSGLGFGFMSAAEEYSNVIAYAFNSAGYDYGTGSYGMGLDDIGLYSALFQYGYIGLTLIVVMTGLVIWAMLIRSRGQAHHLPMAALGCIFAGYVVSPIMMNYFTLFYTSHLGGIMWFLAFAAANPQRYAPIAPRVQAT